MSRTLIAAALAALTALAAAGCNGERGDAPVAAAEGNGPPKEAAASAEEAEPLKAGDRVPSARVRDMDGQPADLAALAAAKPTVFVFYRGGWCPYCTTHLGALATIEPRLAELGYQILAISSEPPQKVAETGEEGGFRYQLLSDSETEAARGFGVAFEVDEATAQRYQEGGIDLGNAPGIGRRVLPVPSVFVAGTDGVIVFAHSDPDYRVRLEAKMVLDAAARAVE